jgi:uncharacterized tellurite resistance protein B-like protein
MVCILPCGVNKLERINEEETMKKLNEKQPEFTKDQFVLFVYLCLVLADGEMKASEINHVFDRLNDDLFEEPGKNGELVVTQVYSAYKKLSEQDREDLMKHHLKKHFANQSAALAFLSQLHALMEVDGLINEQEEKLYHRILAMI